MASDQKLDWLEKNYPPVENHAKFVFEEPPTQGFPPIYLKDASDNTVSTNAGDYFLYVGGGGVNREFCRVLVQCLPVDAGSDAMMPMTRDYISEYDTLQTRLLKKSRQTGGGVVSAGAMQLGEYDFQTFSDECKSDMGQLEILASLCKAGPHASETDGDADASTQKGSELSGEDKKYAGSTGAAFLHIFSANGRPNKCVNNIGMLYVIGPRGPMSGGHGPVMEEKDQFLASMAKLGKTSMEVINAYREKVSGFEGLPDIDQVRWSLVSGGIYRHHEASKIDVAEATIRGMSSVASDVQITFLYDDDAFRLASERLNTPGEEAETN